VGEGWWCLFVWGADSDVEREKERERERERGERERLTERQQKQFIRRFNFNVFEDKFRE